VLQSQQCNCNCNSTQNDKLFIAILIVQIYLMGCLFLLETEASAAVYNYTDIQQSTRGYM